MLLLESQDLGHRLEGGDGVAVTEEPFRPHEVAVNQDFGRQLDGAVPAAGVRPLLGVRLRGGVLRIDFFGGNGGGRRRTGVGLHRGGGGCRRGRRRAGVDGGRRWGRRGHFGCRRWRGRSQKLRLRAVQVPRRWRSPRLLPIANRGAGPRAEQAVRRTGVEALVAEALLDQPSGGPVEGERGLDGGGVLETSRAQGFADSNAGRCGQASDREHAHDERQRQSDGAPDGCHRWVSCASRRRARPIFPAPFSSLEKLAC